MSDYDNNNSGVLFKNDKKEEGSKQPDYNGSAEIDNKQLEIAAWIRTSKTGKKFMSLKFQEPRQKKDAPKGKPEFDDDVAF